MLVLFSSSFSKTLYIFPLAYACFVTFSFIPAVFLSINRFGASHSICILCSQSRNLRIVPKHERYNVIKNFGIYIPEGARLCAEHYNNYSWEDAAPMAVIHEFNARLVEEMVDLLRNGEMRHDISDIDIKPNTGLDCNQFASLMSDVPSLIDAFPSEEDARNALIMFLMRFRKAATYEYIGYFFGVSRHKATDHIERVRIALETDFVPNYLGFDNLSRQFLLQNTTDSSRILHADNNPETLMTIWDGMTYIVIKARIMNSRSLLLAVRKTATLFDQWCVLRQMVQSSTF